MNCNIYLGISKGFYIYPVKEFTVHEGKQADPHKTRMPATITAGGQQGL